MKDSNNILLIAVSPGIVKILKQLGIKKIKLLTNN